MPGAPHLAQCKAHQGTAPWVNLAAASPPFTRGHGTPPPRLIWWQPRPCPQPRGLRASHPALAWMLQEPQHYCGVQKPASCFSSTLTRILPLTRGVWGPPSLQLSGLHGPAHREYLEPHRQFRVVATLTPTTKLGPTAAGTGGGRTLPSAEGARGLTPWFHPVAARDPKFTGRTQGPDRDLAWWSLQIRSSTREDWDPTLQLVSVDTLAPHTAKGRQGPRTLFLPGTSGSLLPKVGPRAPPFGLAWWSPRLSTAKGPGAPFPGLA